MPRIPEPEYLHDSILGAVYDLPDGSTLLIGPPTRAVAGYAPRLSGMLVIRYGIPMQMPSTQALIPGLFVSEKGVALVGRAAWDFMLENFQMYPRADVVGLRAINGAPLQVFLRELDFGAGIRVFVYDSVDVTLPPAEVSRLVISDPAAEASLPELLRKVMKPLPPATA
jgi:hypothetical protein